MFKFSTAGLFVVLAVTSPSVRAYQDTAAPPAAAATNDYESEIPEDVDPLKGEADTVTRVQDDITRLTAIAGPEVGEQLSPLLRTLFDSSAADEERLVAAAELKRLAAELDTSDPLVRSVRRQVIRRATLVEAGLTGLGDVAADDESRAVVNEFLIRATVDAENSNREAYTNEVRRLYRLIKHNHPAVYEQVSPVFSDDYYNYNLHFVVSEPMLSMLISDYRTETGGVADCILGAWVTGCQVTDTMISADIKPSSTFGVFDLVANGRTESNTQGRKKPATVFTRGSHRFRIDKRVFFDGRTITSSKADMSVDPNNRTVGIKTDFDGIPIIRGIARSIARKEVQKKHGQSEAIAARKLADQALPRFEEEVGRKFAEANDNLQNNLLRDLENRGIAPETYSTRSSETHLAMSTRTINGGTLAGSPPPTAPAPARGIAVQIHESTVNAALSTLGLSGATSSDQLIATIEEALVELADKPINIPRPEPKEKLTDFDFESSDAIRIRFEENQVVMLFRTGFYQYEKGAERPESPTLDKQVFEIPIDVTLEGGEIVLTPPPLDNLKEFGARIKQRPADSGSKKGVAALRRALQARKIALELVTAVFRGPDDPEASDKRVPAKVDVLVGGSQRVDLQVSEFEISDGWLTAVFEK